MQTATLSSNGKITVPENIRQQYAWRSGHTFLIIDTGDGILLKPQSQLEVTKLEDVAGCLHRPNRDKAVTLEDMEASIAEGIAK